MSLTLDLKVDNKQLLLALKKRPKTLEKNLTRSINKIVKTIARDAKKKAPKADSHLTNSIIGKMITPLSGEIHAGMNYARAVEQGTGLWGPERRASGEIPPVESILAWVKRKRLVPDDPSMEQEDLAFVIALSISKRGTPPQPFMKPSLDKNKAFARNQVDEAIKRTIRGMK